MSRIRERGATSLSQALQLNTMLIVLDLDCEYIKEDTKRQTSTIHCFPFSSHQQGTRLEIQEQHHWVNHWNQTQHSLYSACGVKTKERRHTKDIHQQFTLFRFSFHQQVTTLETQEQHHWANHLNQTQHSLDSIWKVNTKERRHKECPSTIHSFSSIFNNKGILLETQEQHH